MSSILPHSAEELQAVRNQGIFWLSPSCVTFLPKLTKIGQCLFKLLQLKMSESFLRQCISRSAVFLRNIIV